MNDVDTVETCGEDSFYISAQERQRDNQYVSFGIADGVGGWVEEAAIDPSVFSKALCAGAQEAFVKTVDPHPLDLMEESYQDLLTGGDENAGGSTAVFLVLDRLTGRLETANLGDSGYLIIRKHQVMFRSNAQRFGVSAPFQLSLPPSWLKTQGATPMFGCNDSFVTSHTVQAGDIIIVGSNGLFDNMFDHEILNVSKVFMSQIYERHPTYYTALLESWAGMAAPPPTSYMTKALLNDMRTAMVNMSFALTEVSELFAMHRKGETPYSKVVQSAGYPYEGGRVDDITVVAVYVHPTDPKTAALVKYNREDHDADDIPSDQ